MEGVAAQASLQVVVISDKPCTKYPWHFRCCSFLLFPGQACIPASSTMDWDEKKLNPGEQSSLW